MTAIERPEVDWLAFAIDPALRAVALDFLPSAGASGKSGKSLLHVVDNAGDALRVAYRYQPRVLVVLVGHNQLALSTALIDALRRRRPEMPLLAITPQHAEHIERAVRVGGANYYFALDSHTDERLLDQTLETLGLTNARASPQSVSGNGPSRIRGRPPAVFRSP
jgi:hypothetical protein